MAKKIEVFKGQDYYYYFLEVDGKLERFISKTWQAAVDHIKKSAPQFKDIIVNN